MSVKIRLRRMGAKKQPHYRLVVADARSPRDGRFIDTIGHYDPKSEPLVFHLDEEKAKLWLSRGASPTLAAARVLYKFGLVERPWKEEEPVKEAEAPAKPATRARATARQGAAPAKTETATEPAPAENGATAEPSEE